MFKNITKNIVISWVIAIFIGWGLLYLLIMFLPPNTPYLWIKWMALPIAYGAQKLILNELENPSIEKE
jgi:ABC-type multidrug transport system permease subunit